MAEIRIGTSGWHYDAWRGTFYPKTVPKARLLSCYAERFDTVEINNTFYRLPPRETLQAWARATPGRFLFACKASRFITHMKKLKDPVVSSQKFFDAIEVLGSKLGPILFQLPPGWKADSGRLRDFLQALPAGYRYAFEFRDPRWIVDEVYRLLEEHGAAFCVYDLDRRTSPDTLTAPFAYVRLHGPEGPYQGSYSDDVLRAWSRTLCRWHGEGRDVYCYFDNDQKGYAPHDALRLRRLMGTGAAGS